MLEEYHRARDIGWWRKDFKVITAYVLIFASINFRELLEMH